VRHDKGDQQIQKIFVPQCSNAFI